MAGRVLLDGGFSTQLVEYTGEIIDGDPLWTSRFLATDRDKCIQVHADYVKAGSDIITTGSYQSSIEGYSRYLGLDREGALNVIRDSVTMAKEGIARAHSETGGRRDVLVAGSVGPYGASLHDGSEYTGTYATSVTESQLLEWHEPRVSALVEARADILAIETIPCVKEAVAAVSLLHRYPGLKAWVSFSVRDARRLASGEDILSAVAATVSAAPPGQLLAIGVNCLHPSLILPLARRLVQSPLPMIAYPNSGESYDAAQGRWLDQENSVPVVAHLDEWLAQPNIKYIGGCCRTNAKDIQEFSTKIKQWNLKNTI